MDEKTQIYVSKDIRELLRQIARKDESYDQVIARAILERAKVELPVSADLYNYLRQLAYAMSEPSRILDVSSALSEGFSKLGAILGYRGGGFTNWGVQETAQAKMITFLGIEDPYTLHSAVLMEVLNTLIEEFEVHELRVVKDEIVEILVRAQTWGEPVEAE